MVFKAFDRMSYALVMETTHAIRQGDRAKKSVTRDSGVVIWSE